MKRKSKLRKKSLVVAIRYRSNKGALCPICIANAIEQYNENSRREYKIEDLKVIEL